MDTITLYYGFRESLGAETPFVYTLQVRKIEDVRNISKGISITKYTNPNKNGTENRNVYALVSDELTVCPLGVMSAMKNKKQRTIYVGDKVFTTTKEDLCDYYREQAQKKHIKMQETLKVAQESLIKCAGAANDYAEHYWTNKIEFITRNVKNVQGQYKKLIEMIKNL